MNNKILRWTCTVSLGVVLLTGCTGQLNNRDDPANRHGMSSSPSAYEQRFNPQSYKELHGNGMNGINPDGSGTSDSKWNANRTTANDIRDQRLRGESIAGRTDAMSIYGADGVNRAIIGRSTVMVERLRPLGVNDILVLGDIVVLNVAGNDVKSADFRQYFGNNSLVLKVKDQRAAKAMRRVNDTIDSGNAALNANMLVSDMRIILKFASP
ncbi:hypothetical protein AB6A23_12315 [Paenibacillus tarimensis]